MQLGNVHQIVDLTIRPMSNLVLVDVFRRHMLRRPFPSFDDYFFLQRLGLQHLFGALPISQRHLAISAQHSDWFFNFSLALSSFALLYNYQAFTMHKSIRWWKILIYHFLHLRHILLLPNVLCCQVDSTILFIKSVQKK